MTTKITDKGAARILKTIGELKGAAVDVGAFDEVNAAKLAYAEFGTPTAPARPVIRQTIEARRRQLGLSVEAELDAMIRRGKSTRAALAAIGASVAGELRAAIYAFSDPPNAPTTALRKLKNDPLVNSGEMAERVTWRVVSRRGGRR